MVGVAQLVEHPVVVRDVAGSSPVAHPIFLKIQRQNALLADHSILGMSLLFNSNQGYGTSKAKSDQLLASKTG
jgi:hypothetical protein